MDSTNHPKPHPPIKKVEPEITKAPTQVIEEKVEKSATEVPAKPQDKKPFKLTEHLTERPFKNHEGLQQLKESITEPKTEVKQKPRRSGYRTPRTTRAKGAK